MAEFKKGDRVKLVEQYLNVPAGTLGTVNIAGRRYLGVDFDNGERCTGALHSRFEHIKRRKFEVGDRIRRTGHSRDMGGTLGCIETGDIVEISSRNGSRFGIKGSMFDEKPGWNQVSKYYERVIDDENTFEIDDTVYIANPKSSYLGKQGRIIGRCSEHYTVQVLDHIKDISTYCSELGEDLVRSPTLMAHCVKVHEIIEKTHCNDDNKQVIIMKKPTTNLEKSALKQAKEEAIKVQIDAKAKIYQDSMDEFLRFQKKANEYQEAANELKDKLGITKKEMDELF